MNNSPHFPKLAAFLYDAGHFDAVTKPHRIVGKDARCGVGFEFVNNPAQHACARACSRCHQFECSSRQNPQPCTITCKDCRNKFSAEDCYQNHLRCIVRCDAKKEAKSTCHAYERCADCYSFIRAPGRPRSDPYDCDAQYCSVCKKFVSHGHRCYMKTGSAAIPKRTLVATSKKSYAAGEEHGVEDLVFGAEDFLPDGQAQPPAARTRGHHDQRTFT
ncbi:hypothetical protein RvY_00104 [Ramazzottius varieornatus]|uniref:Uncharacterized protein n=1 Tax=Ramazzottius varieornatus TaxID=947166 RepID=A0A1D1UCK2_RAMVA|nr:hypothetical protein RvY_00104 [Ramazzottius varieornatus]